MSDFVEVSTSGFIELTDSEGNAFLTQKSDINIVFMGGVSEEDINWEGEPCVVAVINDVPTKLKNTYEEVRDLLL